MYVSSLVAVSRADGGYDLHQTTLSSIVLISL